MAGQLSEMTLSENHQTLAEASTLLKAMGNHRRLHILSLLAERERRVGELERLVGLSQSALSQHLARLRRDGVVKTRRQAQTIFYSLAGDDVRAVLGVLERQLPAKAGTPPSVAQPTAFAR